MDMDYTFIMYCHGKQRFSAVSSVNNTVVLTIVSLKYTVPVDYSA